MAQSSATIGMKIKRPANEPFDSSEFPYGLLEIQQYYLLVTDTKGTTRKYMIETHKYQGFVMIKFYPFHLKKDKNKFKLRVDKNIGYILSRTEILKIIFESVLIMRDYIDKNQDEFAGYIGQVDNKDNTRKKEHSQRSSIYNRFTASIFSGNDKYKMSSSEAFDEMNIRLFRINKTRKGGLTSIQTANYECFLNVFEKIPSAHYELMTHITKEKALAMAKRRTLLEKTI